MSTDDGGVPLKLTRRLTLVIHSLAQGGAERDMAHLARCWAERGNDVAVVTLDSVATDSYPLVEGVTRIGLGLAGDSHGWLQAISNNRQRIRALHDVLRQRSPQTVVSFIDRMNVVTLKAATSLGDPVSSRNGSTPGTTNRDGSGDGCVAGPIRSARPRSC